MKMKFLPLILAFAIPASGQIQERLEGYLVPLKKRDGSACFEDLICRTPWVKYNRATLQEDTSVFDHTAWLCEAREPVYWCSTSEGVSCSCSSRKPSGDWQREGEENELFSEIQEHVIKPCSEAVSPFLGMGAGAIRYSYQLELGKVEDAIVTAAHGKPENVRMGIYEASVRMCVLLIEEAAPGG